MTIIVLSLFAGINLSFSVIGYFVFRKNRSQKFYLYFGLFSLFSGLYFFLSALSIHLTIDLHWAILFCAATYYAIFPWFLLDFINKKLYLVAVGLSTLFALAISIFTFYPDPSNYAIWQVLAHLGLIGLLGVTLYAATVLYINKRLGRIEFLALTILFIFLGLEEIFSNYLGQKFLGQYITTIQPLDIYPLLFTLVIGRRLANEVYIKNRLNIQLMESILNEEQLKLENLEKDVLQKKLDSKNKDLTDFGIDILRKKEFTEEIFKKLALLKNEKTNAKTVLNDLILFTKSQMQIDAELNLFQQKIELINHEFINRLKKTYPSLTNSELQLASLLRLKLTTKEIAVIKNISPDSAKVMRYRLRKKMNLATKTSLTQHLQEII